MKTTKKKISDVLVEALMNKQVEVFKITETPGMQGGTKYVGTFQPLGEGKVGKIVQVLPVRSSALLPLYINVMIDKKSVQVQIDAYGQINFVE